jgi:hypothetical protein
MKTIYLFSVFIILSLFTFTAQAKDEDFQPVYESSPKEAVIYNGNTALIKDMLTVYAEKKVSVLLPASVIIESLTVHDNNSTVKSFFFDKPDQGGLYKLNWQSNSPGKRNVELNYLINGINWKPAYNMNILDDTKVDFSYNVIITNNALDLKDVTVKLVSGLIGSENNNNQLYNNNMNMTQSALSDTGYSSSVTGSERVNAYYTYDLGTETVIKGSITTINLVTKNLTCKKHIVWDTRKGQRVDVIYKVLNDCDKPFAEGLVRIYQQGLYMGSDYVEWTPPGSTGSITMGGLSDIRVKKTVSIEEDPEKRGTKEYHHKITLEINNFDSKDLKLKVIDTKYPDRVEVKYDTEISEEVGKTITWEITVPAKGNKKINYEFYSDSCYSEPYINY